MLLFTRKDSEGLTMVTWALISALGHPEVTDEVVGVHSRTAHAQRDIACCSALPVVVIQDS